MKKYLFSLMMMAMGSALVTSCLSDDDSDKKDPQKVTYTSGVFVINNGSWGQNNGSLSYFDYESLQTQQLLQGAGGLGDTPNDAYVKGDTIFVAGAGENTIFVVNRKDFSIIKTISTTETMGEAEGYWPNHITGYGSNIYFTTYGGYVGILDAKTLNMSQLKYQVGSAPAGLTVGGDEADPILFVANSDYGYGNASISKIHLNNGIVDDPITDEQIQNPQEIVAYGNTLYILDWGHYTEDYSQQLDAGLYCYYNGTVTKLIEDATGLGVGLVYLNGSVVVGYNLVTFNAPYGSTSEPTYTMFNTYTGTKSNLVLSGDQGYEIFSPAAIAVDPLRGHIIIASRQKDEYGYASYTLPGYANMYTTQGEYIKNSHFETGIEPHMVGFALTTTVTNQ
ncbi:MAG: hypothetical protein J6W56_03360 [Prevotella sp.]|nr:hypothetical protein [Prevotella sp.]